MRLFRSRAGQIVIPAMLMFPTLFLFVYLIYETAKLSREKIRHQFAMDAASFVEMTNYSDFLNRTAYVNGAFPMRIFEEGYWDFKADCNGKAENGSCSDHSYAWMLFENGAFPHLGGPGSFPVWGHQPEGQSDFVGKGKWNIEYGGKYASIRNSPTPDFDAVVKGDDKSTKFELFWHPIDLATEIYKLYIQIYSLLGSVEEAQQQVLTRLTTGGGVPHSFLQKSYWLNTGDPIGDAAALSASFDAAGIADFAHSIHPHCLHWLDYWGNRRGSGVQPLVPVTTDDVNLAQVTAGSGCKDDGGGLFQIETLDDGMYKTLTAKGLEIRMPWAIPSHNFFNVPLDVMMNSAYPGATLHTTMKLVGGDSSTVPAVWPDPTPKFQVRQFP
jgi:hypothetical protein